MPTLTPTKKLKRNLSWLLVFGFVVALLGLLGFSLLNQGGNGNVKVPFTDPPAFNLKLLEGYSWEGKNEISPAAVKSRPLVLNFWASWCIPCREEAPILEKLKREYEPKGVVFLGVIYQDRTEDALAFLKRYGVTYPNGVDSTGEISIEYGITGIPETFFIGSNGKLQRKYIRPLTEPVLREFLEELIRSK